MPQAMRDERDRVSLVAEPSIHDEATLEIPYRFENGSARDAYLFNVIHRGINKETEQFIADPNIVYVEHSTGKVTVAKHICSIPAGVRPLVPIVPFATKLVAGASVEEVVSLPLPLTPWTAYLPTPTAVAAPEPVLCEAWFEVGYVLVDPQRELRLIPVATTEGPALAIPGVYAATQSLLRVGPFPFRVPVRPWVENRPE